MSRLLQLVALLMLSGCALSGTGRAPAPYEADTRLVVTSHLAVDRLLASVQALRPLDRQQPIIVASLVDIDSLQSSSLGRTISEQLSSQLANSGYHVIELKLRGSIFVKSGEGELLLSRELKEITTSHQAQAVLVGTYSQAINNVYVTIKLVGVTDNQVIAANDYVLPVDTNVRSLLWGSAR